MLIISIFTCLLGFSSLYSGSSSSVPSGREFVVIQKVYLNFGKNIARHVQSRIHKLLRQVVSTTHIVSDNVSADLPAGSDSLFLGFGDCSFCIDHIPHSELNSISAESYRIVYRESGSGGHKLICNGNHLKLHGNESGVSSGSHYGAVACSYHALELLGYAFLHPLEPFIPQKIELKLSSLHPAITHSPQWPIRIFHYHTQHPLELNEVLQGLDIPMFGPLGPECSKSKNDPNHSSTNGVYCERWEDMVQEVDLLFEWCIANKFNRVEWLLLGNYKWKEFDNSDIRRKRMRILTDLGHQYGLLVGADVPIGNIQQHAWYMVNTRLPFSQQVSKIISFF